MRTEDALVYAKAMRLDEGDFEEGKHPRDEGGRFSSAEHSLEMKAAIEKAHEAIGGKTKLQVHRENYEGEHRVSVVLLSHNEKIATTRDLKGPVDPHKLVKEMQAELKAERAERKNRDNHTSTMPVRSRDRTVGGFR